MKDILRILLIALVARAALVGLCAWNGRLPYRLDGAKWSASGDFRYRLVPHRFVDPFIRWDSTAYLSIAFGGYESKMGEQANSAFFPGYPIFGRLAYEAMVRTGRFPPLGTPGDLTPVLAMLIVPEAFFLASLILFFLWARDRFGRDAAFRGAILMIAGPASFLFACVMSESPFLFFSLAAFFFADRRRFFWAAVAAAIAATIRPVGAAIVVPLLWRYAIDKKPDETRASMSWTFFALVPIAVAGSLLMSAEKTGRIGAYFEQQKTFFGHAKFPTFEGIVDMFRFSAHDADWIARDLLQLATLAVIVVAVILLVRARKDVGAWSTSLVLIVVFTALPALSGAVVSMARYAIVIFPLFAIFGRHVPAGRRGLAVYLPLALAQAALFLFWMHQWGWVV